MATAAGRQVRTGGSNSLNILIAGPFADNKKPSEASSRNIDIFLIPNFHCELLGNGNILSLLYYFRFIKYIN